MRDTAKIEELIAHVDTAQTEAHLAALAQGLRRHGCPSWATEVIASRLRPESEVSWSSSALDFAGVRFDGLAVFEQTNCLAPVDFSSAVFAGRAIFVDAAFAGRVSMRQTRFEGPAVLVGAKFYAGVDLADAQFQGPRIGPWGKGRPPRVWTTPSV